MLKLAVCLLLATAPFTRCAVVTSPSSTAAPEVQRGTHVVSQHDEKETVGEELQDVGVVAQKTGHVLYKLGVELERAVTDHAIYDDDVAEYASFKERLAEIKAALKNAATTVKAKVKNATAVLKEKAKIAAVVVKDRVKHAGSVLKDIAIDVARDAISSLVRQILEMKMRDLLGVHSLDENSTTYKQTLLQLSKEVRVLGLELVQKGVELSDGVAADVDLTDDQREFVKQVVEALVKP